MSELLRDEEWMRLMVDGATSTKVFANVFMQERFFRPFSSITDQIFQAIDDPRYNKVLIEAPRGWGKTSITSIAYPGRHICFRSKKFIVPISCTATKAMMETENLKIELTQNPLITNMFPDLKSELWTKDQFLAGDTFILPRGAGQQVRGLNYRGNRPDLIIVDDLEDSEGVRSDDQRLKLKEWFFADVENSVDRGRNDWKIVVIGTLLHEDSLLMNLAKDPAWHVVKIQLCDENFKSNWPDFLTDKQVLELYEDFRDKGAADVFAREYQNIPISSHDAVFKKEYFQYYDPAELMENRGIVYCTIIDPAKTVKLQSADSAVVTVGVDQENHKIYFVDCTAGKMYPDELYDAIFEHMVTHGTRILAIEVTSLHEFITQPIKNEMRRRSVHATFIELLARDKKENRIAQLAPFYRQGLIWHNAAVSQKLEMELMGFPRSALWDVMDAFAYIIELMEKDEQYFFPAELEDGGNEGEYDALADVQYRDVGIDWRVS
ncbi:MAG: hypothetical protein RR450_03655 [Oscillospiraceae bacterium]